MGRDISKRLIKANTTKRDNTTFTRPPGAGNFDNMDDFNIVDFVNIKTGTCDLAPTQDKHIVNKKYVDDEIQTFLGQIKIVTSNPATATEGQMILNSTNHSIYIWYLADWRILHTISITEDFLLLQNGDYILLQNGDLIIK